MPNCYHKLDHFHVAGINYRKSDIAVRGKFSLSPEQSDELLKEAVKKFPSCFVLSTCNRTEVYALCDDPGEIIDLLCIHTHGTKHDFQEYGYIKKGLDATEHLFKVAAGLDSQIVGDYEILSQLKHAIKVARGHDCLNSFVERLVNYALQASKAIKTNTKLSSGTVSVAYAAIEIIKAKTEVISGKKILLVGTGKFGNHIAKNVKTYLPGSLISVTNRTDEKALAVSQQYDVKFIPYHLISTATDEADIIIVSSAAENYTILPGFFKTHKSRLVLDLSVPQNVDPGVKLIPGIDINNVDEISAILDKTISIREAEIPLALEIIRSTIIETIAWYRKQSDNPLLRKVKSQLYELKEFNTSDHDHEQSIHQTVTSLALTLRDQNNKGCQCIHALSNYLHINYASTA